MHICSLESYVWCLLHLFPYKLSLPNYKFLTRAGFFWVELQRIDLIQVGPNWKVSISWNSSSSLIFCSSFMNSGSPKILPRFLLQINILWQWAAKFLLTPLYFWDWFQCCWCLFVSWIMIHKDLFKFLLNITFIFSWKFWSLILILENVKNKNSESINCKWHFLELPSRWLSR